MSDEIKTITGRVVGNWTGESVEVLRSELERIRGMLREENSTERLVAKQMPHRDQLPQDLQSFKAYHIWGCDRSGRCLVGTQADRIETVEKVRAFSLIEHH